MNKSTETAVKALLGADSTIPTEVAEEVLSILSGRKMNRTESITPGEKLRGRGKILKAVEVAKLLGVAEQTVYNWRKSGMLTPVIPKGRRKAAGYWEADVLALAGT